MGMPPSPACFSTTNTSLPSAAASRAASSPPGPEPITSTRPDRAGARCPPPSDPAGAGCPTPPLDTGVLPGQILDLSPLDPGQVLRELLPGRLPVDPHLLQKRPVVGAVPVGVAHAVGVGAHRQGSELGV